MEGPKDIEAPQSKLHWTQIKPHQHNWKVLPPRQAVFTHCESEQYLYVQGTSTNNI